MPNSAHRVIALLVAVAVVLFAANAIGAMCLVRHGPGDYSRLCGARRVPGLLCTSRLYDGLRATYYTAGYAPAYTTSYNSGWYPGYWLGRVNRSDLGLSDHDLLRARLTPASYAPMQRPSYAACSSCGTCSSCSASYAPACSTCSASYAPACSSCTRAWHVWHVWVSYAPACSSCSICATLRVRADAARVPVATTCATRASPACSTRQPAARRIPANGGLDHSLKAPRPPRTSADD